MDASTLVLVSNKTSAHLPHLTLPSFFLLFAYAYTVVIDHGNIFLLQMEEVKKHSFLNR